MPQGSGIFSQGEVSDSVHYLQSGAVKVTVTSSAGKEAVIALLEPGDFFEEHEFSDRFVAHTLKRNVRIEEDLVDQLFNSSEKSLARALLLIAGYAMIK